MTLKQLKVVRNYLMDYLRTHALTDAEWHCVAKMLRDIDKQCYHMIYASMTDDELKHEYDCMIAVRRVKTK